MNIYKFIETINSKIESGEILPNAKVMFNYGGIKQAVRVDYTKTKYQNQEEYWIVIRDPWGSRGNIIYTVTDLIRDLTKYVEVCRNLNNGSDENIYLSYEGSGYHGCPYKVENWEYDKNLNCLYLSKYNNDYVVKADIKYTKKLNKRDMIRRMCKSGYQKMLVNKNDIEKLNTVLDGKCKIIVDENNILKIV